VCAANEERNIALHSLDLQKQGLSLTQRLRDAGRGDETQVTRSQTQFRSLRAELPRYEAAQKSALYRLSMLLARPLNQLPKGVAECAELPHIAQVMPVGDGAALLKRRPDVRQAERRLAMSTAAIGVATGELYPDISIGATVGTVGILDELGDPSTNRWGFGGVINWTIPSNGARARIHIAEASNQVALARFDGVVLNAIREAQTGLSQYTALLERRDALIETSLTCKPPAPTPTSPRNWRRPTPRWQWGRLTCSWRWVGVGRTGISKFSQVGAHSLLWDRLQPGRRQASRREMDGAHTGLFPAEAGPAMGTHSTNRPRIRLRLNPCQPVLPDS